MKKRPIIFLSFANHSHSYLSALHKEANAIQNIFQAKEDQQTLLVKNFGVFNLQHLYQQVNRYREEMVIFHYAGHANAQYLGLQDEDAQLLPLADFLSTLPYLRLIFLNGCNTGKQMQEFKQRLESASDNHYPKAIIATNRPVSDQIAAELAQQFYEALEGGANIQEAFQSAKAYLEAKELAVSIHQPRFVKGFDPDTDEFNDWELFYEEVAALDWKLTKRFFDLPRLDVTKYILPPNPFIGLNYYTKAMAPLFLGRTQDVYELYQKVVAPNNHLLLYYGLSGVGKSSLLFAGLVPRLQAHAVIYLRRTNDQSLTDSLRKTLLAQLKNQPENVQENMPHKISFLWQSLEETLAKPLVVVFDQIEEVYTNPLRGNASHNSPHELEAFLEVMKEIFGGYKADDAHYNAIGQVQNANDLSDTSTMVKGKLVLSFRSEFYAQIEQQFEAQNVGFLSHYLAPLKQENMVEIFEGLAQGVLNEKYNLTVEENLPAHVASSLAVDQASNLSPVLQILLTKMWTEAIKKERQNPRFTLELYEGLRKKGLLLQDYVEEQFELLKAWKPAVVESGLVLDVLYRLTTPLGTATAIPAHDLQSLYSHIDDLPIQALLERLQDGYLVSKRTQQNIFHYRLSHDTIAPVIRKYYNDSTKLGQRANRLLESRLQGLDEPAISQVRLVGDDLQTVEQGLSGMRKLNETEVSVLAKSQGQRLTNAKKRTRNRWYLRGLLGVVAIAGVVLAVLAVSFNINRKLLTYKILVDARSDVTNHKWKDGIAKYQQVRDRGGYKSEIKKDLQQLVRDFAYANPLSSIEVLLDNERLTGLLEQQDFLTIAFLMALAEDTAYAQRAIKILKDFVLNRKEVSSKITKNQLNAMIQKNSENPRGQVMALIQQIAGQKFIAQMEKRYFPEFVEVAGGTYRMRRKGTDTMLRKVNDFMMSKYEVTNKQFVLFLNIYGRLRPKVPTQDGKLYEYNPFSDIAYIVKVGKFWKVKENSDSIPVLNVNWYAANMYCKWIGALLPTELQWEYAAAGGRYDQGLKYGISNTIDSTIAVYGMNYPQKIGGTRPNQLKIYNMLGNVPEWCADAAEFGSTQRVIRGGHFQYSDQNLSLVKNYDRAVINSSAVYLGIRPIK